MRDNANFNKITFTEYLQLGREQSILTDNKVKKLVFSMIGILPINPRIRSGRILNEILRENLPIDANLLDAGFGAGLSMFYLAKKYLNWNITGYEFDKNLVDDAKTIKIKENINNLIVMKIDLEKMTGDSKFDLIYSCDVLEHINDDIKVLDNFYKALKPNGRLILHLPFRYKLNKRIFPWFKNYKTHDHVREEYTLEEITEKLKQTGFTVDFQGYGYGLLKGEMAFELNNFFGTQKLFLILSQLITLPISLVLGYLDISNPPKRGNSIVVKARK